MIATLRRRSRSRTQRGIGLIEILIAVVVISIGFLGAARLQVNALRTTHDTYHRAQAHLMAGDIIERIRANVAGAEAGHYDALTTSDSAAEPSCTGGCAPAQIALQDLRDWSAHLHPFGRTSGFKPLLSSVATEADAEGDDTRGDGADAAIPSGCGHDPSACGSVTRTAAGRYTVLVVWGERIDGVPTQGRQRVDFVLER